MEKAEKAQLRMRMRALKEQVDILSGLIEAIPEPKEPVKFDLRPPEMRDEYFTAAEAQEFLRTKPSTFYEWIRKGRLPKGQLFGPKSPRWKRSDLEKAAKTQ